MGTYDEGFRASVTGPEAFWLGTADPIDWSTNRLVDEADRGVGFCEPVLFYRWLPDGELNVTHTDLDRHVESSAASRLSQSLTHSPPTRR